MTTAIFGSHSIALTKEEIELLKMLISRCKLDTKHLNEKKIVLSLSDKFNNLDNPLSPDKFSEVSFTADLTVSTITVLRKEHHA